MFELEKKENKKLKSFQKLMNKPEPSVQSEQAESGQCKQRKRVYQNLEVFPLKKPYLKVVFVEDLSQRFGWPLQSNSFIHR